MSFEKNSPAAEDFPEYERSRHPMRERQRWAAAFARQIELTAGPLLDVPFSKCRVLDIGCGYGHTAVALARRCGTVVGLEPNPALVREAKAAAASSGLEGVEILHQNVGDMDAPVSFDLAIMDNVLEHIEDQREALHQMSALLTLGGVAFLLIPNKLWPIEVHYRLPFLSYLPLSAANLYLRAAGKGRDYRDASYAPTYFGLQRLLRERPELTARFTLPADTSLAQGGASAIYSVGTKLIRRWPALWAVSKSFLVLAKKTAPTPAWS
jgi:2-polyprenyl-3-methyl-5-hydroxy-6-metoxy-1,4-benzoquinol methylase